MISVDVPKQDTKKKEATPSLSQQNLRREAKAEAKKKMSVEKCERLKKAGVVK